MRDIRAVPTNGIGSTGNTAHLNLTVTMADIARWERQVIRDAVKKPANS